MKAKAPGLRLRLPWSGHLGPPQPPTPQNRPLWAARAAPRAGEHGLQGRESVGEGRGFSLLRPGLGRPRPPSGPAAVAWPPGLAEDGAPKGSSWALPVRAAGRVEPAGRLLPSRRFRVVSHTWLEPQEAQVGSCVLPSPPPQAAPWDQCWGHHGCSRGPHSRWQCPQCPRVVGGGEPGAQGCHGDGRNGSTKSPSPSWHAQNSRRVGQSFPSPPLHPSPGCS